MLSQPIQSKRLTLRDMTAEDAAIVFSIWNNPDNDKYMGDPVGSVDEIVAICQDKHHDDSYLKVAELLDTHEIIGTCCFGPTTEAHEWGFGYSLRQPFWGQGFATEIVQTIIQYGKDSGITDFITDCAEENAASARVMIKCGMTLASRSSFVQPNSGIEYPSLIYKLKLDKASL